ncbi:MAG TPA: CHASE2 domain-containing protein [Chitinophagaceae bacterium]
MKKPIHKKIGQGIKKYHRHFTKYLYERDTIFATIWVFLFIIVLGSIPINLGIINPIKLGLKDFDFNDLSYSKLGKADLGKEKNKKFDNRIVIINIGQADRAGLAMMIDKAGTMNPKVMALDVLFYAEKDREQDSLLEEAFKRNKNLIAAHQLLPSGPDGDTIVTAGDYIKTASNYAFVNLFTDSLSSIRYYEPFEKDYKKKLYKSFTSAIVQAYDSAAYKELRKKGNSKTLINYSRNLSQYQIIPWETLMTDQADSSALAGKIVLFGYISTNKDDISDKFFTPMNSRFYGKSVPDMNGIVIHANIISMVLDDNYVKKLPSWVNWLVALLIGWLHMSFFVRYYLESHIWFHLVAKIAQVLSAIFFVWLGIYLFDSYRIKLDLKLSLIVIVMAVDVIYFYEAFAVWMHKKYHYHTVFHQKHH